MWSQMMGDRWCRRSNGLDHTKLQYAGGALPHARELHVQEAPSVFHNVVPCEV